MLTFLDAYGQMIGFGVVIGALIFLLIFMVVTRPKVKPCCKIGQVSDNQILVYQHQQNNARTEPEIKQSQKPFPTEVNQ